MEAIDSKKINNVLKKAGVAIPAELIRESKTGLFCVYKSRRNGIPVIIKIVAKAYRAKCHNLIKEFEADQILKKINNINGNNGILWPNLLDRGEDETFLWIIREYIDGSPWTSGKDRGNIQLGNDRLGEGLGRKNEFIVDKIIKYLKLLQVSNKPAAIMERDKRFFDDLSFYHLEFIAKGLGRNIDNALLYYEQNRSKYLGRSNQTICTGDLVPSNIIVSADKQVYLSDFEWLAIDNKMFDAAFLWLFLWRHKKLQEMIIKKMIDSDGDKNNFRLTIIRIMIGWFDVHFQTESPATELNAKNRQRCKNHIWAEYLQGANSSFEEIVLL